MNTNGNPETLKEVFQEIYGDGTIRPTNTEVIEKLVEHAVPALEFIGLNWEWEEETVEGRYQNFEYYSAVL